MHGIVASSVEITGIQPEKTPALLENGEVDAVASWEPYVQLAQRDLGGDALLVPHQHFYLEAFNLLARKTFVAAHPSEVRRLLQILIKAVHYINRHPDESRGLVAQRFEKDPDLIGGIWSDLRFAVNLDQWLITTLEAEARWALERGFAEGDTVPNYMDYIHYRALEQLAPERVGLIH